MDKELEKIIKRSKSGEPQIRPEPKETKTFPKNQPYDHLVFTKLVRFSGLHKLLFLFIFPAALCVGFLFPGFETEAAATLIIYAGLVVLYLLVNWYRYHFRFKGWQERLPFLLEGWNEMIHEKKMFCDLCWNHTRIGVQVSEESHEIQELVRAALKIFAKRSKMAFYEQKTSSSSTHSRKDWKVISHTIAEGSANPEVMGYMKDVFQRELSTIARKTGKIKKVKVTLLSEEFQVDIEISVGAS